MFKEDEVEFMEQYFKKIMKSDDFSRLIDRIKKSKAEIKKKRIYSKKTKEQKKKELDELFSSYDKIEIKIDDDAGFGVVLEKDNVEEEELFGYNSE